MCSRTNANNRFDSAALCPTRDLHKADATHCTLNTRDSSLQIVLFHAATIRTIRHAISALLDAADFWMDRLSRFRPDRCAVVASAYVKKIQ